MTGTLAITWEPGSDTLLGTCHCGARHASQDPIEAWAWLLAHPEGHSGGHSGGPEGASR